MVDRFQKRAALYIRVSSDEQARHGFSLGEQRIDLERYAREKGYTIAGLYADEGASARKAISRRHGLQRLLNDVAHGNIDLIVMKCLDRWMRSVRDFYRVQEILDAHDVALEFTQEPDYNTSTTQGRLMLNLKLSIAQHESDTTGDRIRYVFAGMRRDKRIISGRVPFGYRVRSKKIVIEPREAEIVRYVFGEVLRGRSAYSLLDDVFSRFGVEIRYTTLLWILRNRSYTGTMQGIENVAEPIVTTADFGRAQEVLARHPRKKSTSRVYLFSGLLICPVCGRRLCGTYKRNGNKLSPYYLCQNHYKSTKQGDNACTFNANLNESRIESYLVTNIADLISQQVREIETNEHHRENPADTLKKVSRSLERLNEIYVLGNIPKETYRAKYDALKKQERILLAETIPHAIKIPAILRGDSFRASYLTWTPEEKRAFWQGLIKRIEFNTTTIPRNSALDCRVSFFALEPV